jgi:hypothetical protein
MEREGSLPRLRLQKQPLDPIVSQLIPIHTFVSTQIRFIVISA